MPAAAFTRALPRLRDLAIAASLLALCGGELAWLLLRAEPAATAAAASLLLYLVLGQAHLRTRERLLTGAAFALTLWAARGDVPLAPLVQQAMRQATFLAAFMMLLTLLKEGAAIALLTLAVGWLEDRFTGARLSAVLSRHEIPVRTAVPFPWRALHRRATSTGPGRRRRRPYARAPECSGAMPSDARSGAPA